MLVVVTGGDDVDMMLTEQQKTIKIKIHNTENMKYLINLFAHSRG